jgi:hypothetical protein
MGKDIAMFQYVVAEGTTRQSSMRPASFGKRAWQEQAVADY